MRHFDASFCMHRASQFYCIRTLSHPASPMSCFDLLFRALIPLRTNLSGSVFCLHPDASTRKIANHGTTTPFAPIDQIPTPDCIMAKTPTAPFPSSFLLTSPSPHLSDLPNRNRPHKVSDSNLQTKYFPPVPPIP